MDDHVRQRRKFLPKLAAEVPLQIEDWVRDDLPDLLWPALVLAQRGTKFGVSFVRWQDAVQRDLKGQVDIKILAECLDGRLTSLDRLVGELPGAAASVKLRATETRHGSSDY